MFCPRCATENADETKFCRACGANLALVPQAMTGRLPEAPPVGRRRHRRERSENSPPNLAKGITQLIMGFGFLVVAAAIYFTSPGGRGWWWAMLFPAFSLMGGGISRIVSSVTQPQIQSGSTQTTQTAMPPVRNTGEIPPRQSYDSLPSPPPSVTEGTTRHLDPAKDRYDKHR